ncbi:hypothetical protein [Aeromicrobium choanae]|uniref:Uncharacterized protein n=1 Tax=Aeromicrobium choanae TaxID=1736691 RepID=A0A1T4Z1V8_9ACTN|nr:hypothetical protein [Aeromicrobium choanae]SKB07551.1 hypothetical protein SAMN06295964_1736 [Aeromicrobium choanae]
MRVRVIAIAVVTGLVLALAPLAAQAASTYTVSLSINASQPTVGTKLKLSGKVSGPKAAGKQLLVQRKVGRGTWKTVAKVRTTTRRGYTARVKVPTAGRQYVRVVAPSSSSAAAGTSPARRYTGFRWLDLTKQRHATGGEPVNGPVTIAGKRYRKAFTFRDSGVYFNTGGKCTTLRGSVGTPDDAAGRLVVLTARNADFDDEREYHAHAAAGAAPKRTRFPVTGKGVLAFGDDNSAKRVSIVFPKLRCSVNTLPRMELRPLGSSADFTHHASLQSLG